MTINAELVLGKAATIAREVGTDLFEKAWHKARELGLDEIKWSSTVCRLYSEIGAPSLAHGMHQFVGRPDVKSVGYLVAVARSHSEKMSGTKVPKIFRSGSGEATAEETELLDRLTELRGVPLLKGGRLGRCEELSKAGKHKQAAVCFAEAEVVFWKLKLAQCRRGAEEVAGWFSERSCERMLARAEEKLLEAKKKDYGPDGFAECPPDVWGRLESNLSGLGDMPGPKEEEEEEYPF